PLLKIYNSMAVRMAQACYLDRDPDDPYILAKSPQMTWLEKEIRRRTWWMCFCVDRIQSTIHGTPAILPASDGIEERVMMPGSPVGDEVWFGQKGGHDEYEEIHHVHQHPTQHHHEREGITSMLDNSVVFAKVYYDVHVYERNILELQGLDVCDLPMLKKLEDDLRRWFEAFWNLEEEEELMAKLNRLATRKSSASSSDMPPQQHPEHPELASLDDVPRNSPSTPAGNPGTMPKLEQDPVRLKEVLGVLRRSCVVAVHATDRIAVILNWLVKMLAGPEAATVRGNSSDDGQSDNERGSGMGSGGGVGGEGAASVAAMVLSTLTECTLFDSAVGQLLVGLLARAHAGYLSRSREHAGFGGIGSENVDIAAARDVTVLYERVALRAEKGRQDYRCTMGLLKTMMLFWKIAVNMIDAVGVLDQLTGGDGTGQSGGSIIGGGEWRIPETPVFWRFLKSFRGYFLAGEREYLTAPTTPSSSVSTPAASTLASGLASPQTSYSSDSSSPSAAGLSSRFESESSLFDYAAASMPPVLQDSPASSFPGAAAHLPFLTATTAGNNAARVNSN
ncbi:hypothetical protein HK102_002972, partial [Quaeritorhiza haematococci]